MEALEAQFADMIRMFADPGEHLAVVSAFRADLRDKARMDGGLAAIAAFLAKLRVLHYQDRYDRIGDWLLGVPTFDECTTDAARTPPDWGKRLFRLYQHANRKLTLQRARSCVRQSAGSEFELLRLAERRHSLRRLGVHWEDAPPPYRAPPSPPSSRTRSRSRLTYTAVSQRACAPAKGAAT